MKKTIASIILLLAVVYLTACGSSAVKGGSMPQTISFTSLGTVPTEDTGLDNSPRYKVYFSNPGFKLNLDFKASFLIVADWGAKGSSGYAIKIVGITKTEPATFEVAISQTVPEPGKMYLTVMTNPTDMVSVKREVLPKSGKVKFIFKTEGGKVLAEDELEAK